MKRQSVFIPKNTCTINICCLAKKESFTASNSEQLVNLSLAGLGKKRVVFSDKDGDHYFFQETLKKNFQKLKKLEGAFALYRAASGGSSCRQLLKIWMGQGRYSLEYLRVSCSVGSSSTLYVVPIQQDTFPSCYTMRKLIHGVLIAIIIINFPITRKYQSHPKRNVVFAIN